MSDISPDEKKAILVSQLLAMGFKEGQVISFNTAKYSPQSRVTSDNCPKNARVISHPFPPCILLLARFGRSFASKAVEKLTTMQVAISESIISVSQPEKNAIGVLTE
eukprot:1393764-Amorphochlora_amoeboformis.AAC.1